MLDIDEAMTPCSTETSKKNQSLKVRKKDSRNEKRKKERKTKKKRKEKRKTTSALVASYIHSSEIICTFI